MNIKDSGGVVHIHAFTSRTGCHVDVEATWSFTENLLSCVACLAQPYVQKSDGCALLAVVEVTPSNGSDPYLQWHACARHIYEMLGPLKGDPDFCHYELRVLSSEESKTLWCCAGKES